MDSNIIWTALESLYVLHLLKVGPDTAKWMSPLSLPTEIRLHMNKHYCSMHSNILWTALEALYVFDLLKVGPDTAKWMPPLSLPTEIRLHMNKHFGACIRIYFGQHWRLSMSSTSSRWDRIRQNGCHHSPCPRK